MYVLKRFKIPIALLTWPILIAQLCKFLWDIYQRGKTQ